MTEKEYECYLAFQKWPNTNPNIIRLPKNDRIRIRILFGFPKMTEYEYEYYSVFQKCPNKNTNIIRLSKNYRIRIRILFSFPKNDRIQIQISFGFPKKPEYEYKHKQYHCYIPFVVYNIELTSREHHHHHHHHHRASYHRSAGVKTTGKISEYEKKRKNLKKQIRDLKNKKSP